MDIPEIQKRFPQLVEPVLLERIANVGKSMHFEAGENIMDYGRYIRMVPMVSKGLIKVMRQDDQGNEIFLYYLHPGQTCALSLSCCMANAKSEVRAEAEEDTDVIALPVEYVDRWIKEFTSWKNFVMNTYSDRFNEMLRALDAVAFLRMDERLLRYLQEKRENTGQVILHVSHQDIAHELNTSREVISRLLKKMEKQGALELGRNRIRLLDLSQSGVS